MNFESHLDILKEIEEKIKKHVPGEYVIGDAYYGDAEAGCWQCAINIDFPKVKCADPEPQPNIVFRINHFSKMRSTTTHVFESYPYADLEEMCKVAWCVIDLIKNH